MARYGFEIITNKGNMFRDGKKTLLETRIEACKLAKKYDAVCYIRKWENYYWHTIEHVFYDPSESRLYNDFPAGFYLQKVRGKRSRVSPKTGKLLDISRTWKRI